MSEPLRPPPSDRDPALDAAWRAHSTELPPPSVDAAILAAAHREVAARPLAADDDTLAEAREPSRWWWGLAAAATIGAIAFGLVQLAPFGTSHDPTRATDMPSAESAARPAVVAAPPPAEAPARIEPQATAETTVALARIEAPVREPAPAARAPASPQAAKPVPRSQQEPPAVPPATAPQPSPLAAAPAAAPAAPASAPMPMPQGATLATRERAAEPMAKRAVPAADTARLAAAGASAERAVVPRPAEDFVLRIRELHEAGRLDEAARELVAFRSAYPDADAKLPPELRSWAATVRP
jgi:hypothetical protein